MIASDPSVNIPVVPSTRRPAGSPEEPSARRFPVRFGSSLHLDRTRGLCTNCELRPECAFPVTEGGVWHCEEYV